MREQEIVNVLQQKQLISVYWYEGISLEHVDLAKRNDLN